MVTKRRRETNGRRPARRSRFRWERLSERSLLGVRICDLALSIEGTWLEGAVQEVYGELERRGLRLRPHVWLSQEWFSPIGVPGVAIPFYLAHPRLAR